MSQKRDCDGGQAAPDRRLEGHGDDGGGATTGTTARRRPARDDSCRVDGEVVAVSAATPRLDAKLSRSAPRRGARGCSALSGGRRWAGELVGGAARSSRCRYRGPVGDGAAASVGGAVRDGGVDPGGGQWGGGRVGGRSGWAGSPGRGTPVPCVVAVRHPNLQRRWLQARGDRTNGEAVSTHVGRGPASRTNQGSPTGSGRSGTWWAVAAWVWTCVLGVVWLVVPLGSSGSTTVLSDGTQIVESSRETLLDSEGISVVALLAVPVLIAALAVVASRWRHARQARFVARGRAVRSVLGRSSVDRPALPARSSRPAGCRRNDASGADRRVALPGHPECGGDSLKARRCLDETRQRPVPQNARRLP